MNVVIVWRGKDVRRVMTFESSQDALDTWEAYRDAGIGVSLAHAEHFTSGERPRDLPPPPVEIV